jgi:PAS domain S-box-containing protein
VYRSREAGLILLAVEDITDRKRAAEAKYRRLFEAAKDGIVIINADSGEIIDVNPFFVELFGVSRTDLMGKQFWKVQPLDGIKDGQSAFEHLRKQKVVRFPDIVLETRDKRRVEVDIVANVYQEGSKNVAQFNIRDITERKHFDQQLQQAAHLESLGILAGGIAHDFNNLLAGILGNAGLALSDAPTDSPYRSALKDVVLASQRAADLTRQMLAYAGKGRFVVHPVSISEIVRDITHLVRSSIPKSIEVEFELAEHLPSVEADSGQIQQVIMNLVINAAEAVDEGHNGRVRIITKAEQLTADYLRRYFAAAELNPGSYVSLEVTDNGSGMDEKTQAHIFDPFFTTKFTGRGLGLASVQGIIRAHHGTIRVQSAPGKGTTFHVLLPAVAAIKAQSVLEPDPKALGGSGLVLVVDDEEIVLRTTSAILERHGYRVLTVANGALGVQSVREKKDELALVILDLTMPVMGGEEALEKIKAIAPELPVILSSGYDASQAISRFGENTLAGFIQKPGTVTRLLETVKAALQKS